MIHVSQSHPLFLTKYTFWFCRSIRRSTDRTRSYLEILEQWFVVFFHGPGEKKGTEFAIRPQKRCINLQIKKLGWQSQLLYLGHVWKDSFIKRFPWFWLFFSHFVSFCLTCKTLCNGFTFKLYDKVKNLKLFHNGHAAMTSFTLKKSLFVAHLNYVLFTRLWRVDRKTSNAIHQNNINFMFTIKAVAIYNGN